MSRSTSYRLRLSPTAKAGLKAAASAEDLTLSAWIRQTLFRALAQREVAGLEAVAFEEAETSIQVPVSEAESETLRALAHGAGLPLGRWVRLALREERPREQRSVADQELLDQLRRIGVNLNQLARLANSGHFGSADGRVLVEVLEAVAGKLGEAEVRLVEADP